MNKLEKMRTKFLYVPNNSVRSIAYNKIPTILQVSWSKYIQKHNLRNPTVNINSMIDWEINECLRS